MFNVPQAAPQRRFLELTIAGAGKKLFMPADAVLTYEEVPEGKNPHFPEAGTFLRYDFGEGLAFSIVTEDIEAVKAEVGTDIYFSLRQIDDAQMYVRKDLLIAAQEKEDEEITATQLSLSLGGQVGSLFVKNSYEEIKAQREA